MIRKAIVSDLSQIQALWLVSFDDDASYVSSFFKFIGKPDCCLVYEIDNKVVSMLFLLPGEIVVHGNPRKLQYVYAGATLPEYRGCGYMRELLEHAYSEARRDLIFAITLIPATKELFQFYERLGFQRLFQRPVFTIDDAKKANATPLVPDVLANVIELRDQCLNSELAVRWPAEHIAFALNCSTTEKGAVIFSENGYCLFEYKTDIEPKEILPLSPKSVDWKDDYALIRFCEDYEIPEGVLPYFNFGLD